MSDPGFVAAAYGLVLGGLALYLASVLQRLRAARRTARSLARERARDDHAGVPVESTDASAVETAGAGPAATRR